MKLGFEPIVTSQNTFVRKQESRAVMILVWVDDFIVMGQDLKLVEQVKEEILGVYEGTDFGDIKKFLGLNIDVKAQQGIVKMDAHEYIQEFLEENNDITISPRRYLLPKDYPDKNEDATKNNMLSKKQSQRYLQILGALRYLTTSVRADLIYAVRRLCHFMHAPTEHHWDGLVHILGYVATTPHHGLMYSKYSPKLEAYADASFNPAYEDTSGITGSVIFYGGAPVHWSSKRANIKVESTMDVELIALANAATMICNLRLYLYELGFANMSPVVVYEDNNPLVMTLENGKEYRSHTLRSKYRMVLKDVKNGYLMISKIGTNNQLADYLTKPIAGEPFWTTIKKLRILESSGDEISSLPHHGFMEENGGVLKLAQNK